MGTLRLPMSHFFSEPQPTPDQLEARYHRVGIAADAQSVSDVRRHFGQWLTQNTHFSETRLGDLLVATYEALSNAAEYAYLASPGEGTIDLLAHYEPGLQRFTVTVIDRGTWRQPVDPQPGSQLRGRGIMLMRALADDVTINSSAAGTQVRLYWQ